MSKTSSALQGGAAGASAGAAFGPYGAAIGGGLGLVGGYLFGSDDAKVTDAPIDPNAAKLGGQYGGSSTEALIKHKAELEAQAQAIIDNSAGRMNPHAQANYNLLMQQAQGIDEELGSYRRVETDRLTNLGAESQAKMDNIAADLNYKAEGLAQQGQNERSSAYFRANNFDNLATGYDNRENPQLDLSGVNAAAGQQQNAIGKLQSFLDRGPSSVAEQQLKYGADRAINAAGSLAASGRGYGVSAAARRDALNAQAAQLGQLNMQQGIVRAQEQNDWNQQQIAGQSQVASLQGDARNQALAESGRAADIALTGRGQNDVAAQNTRSQANQALGQGIDANIALSGQGIQQEGLALNAAQDAINIRRGYEGDATNVTNNAGNMKLGAATTNANNAQAASQANVAAGTQEKAATTNALAQGAAAVSTAAPPKDPPNRASDVRNKQNIHEADVASELSQLRELVGKQAPPTQYPTVRQPGQPPTARFADVGAPPTRRYDLTPAQPYSYQYTPQARATYGEDARTNVGPMAQDLEKTPLRSAVSKGPDGRKVIDTGKLTLGLTGAVAEQQSEQDNLRQEIERLRALVDRRDAQWRSQPNAVQMARGY